MLPNFIVIGAAKAGSTSLWQYLRGHPQIFMAEEKEPEFFIESGNWSRGRRWYESQFDRAGDAIAVGEASVRYTTHPFRPGAAERMASTIPDAKLIYLVGEPVARMVSQWKHNVEKFAEGNPLAVALHEPRYLLPSSYAYQAERFLEHFPPERLLIVQSGRLRHDRGATLDRIFRFLGVAEGYRGPELDVEFNRTNGLVVPRPVVRRLGRLRGAGRVRSRVPETVARALRPLTHIEAEATLLPCKLRAELRERLHDDVARLRTYAEPSFEGWGIA